MRNQHHVFTHSLCATEHLNLSFCIREREKEREFVGFYFFNCLLEFFHTDTSRSNNSENNWIFLKKDALKKVWRHRDFTIKTTGQFWTLQRCFASNKPDYLISLKAKFAIPSIKDQPWIKCLKYHTCVASPCQVLGYLLMQYLKDTSLPLLLTSCQWRKLHFHCIFIQLIFS